MSSAVVTPIIAGSFALAGTGIGAILAYWLGLRARQEQRSHDEQIRVRDVEIAERKALLPKLSDSETVTVRKHVSRGGLIYNPSAGRFDSRNPVAACFPAGTKVRCSGDIWEPIENLQIGDSIRTYDTTLHVQSSADIEDVVSGEVEDFVVVNGSLFLTPRQQIFCNGYYCAANDLPINGVLVSGDHTPVIIRTIETVESAQSVYSLIFSSDLGYFVRAPESEYSFLVREARTGKI